MISREFESCLPNGAGSLRIDCACGRHHFAADSIHSDSFEPGELESLMEKAQANSDQYVGHNQDSVGSYQVAGCIYVWGCPCAQLEKMEKFLVSQQEWILEFYKQRHALSVEQLKQTDKMLEVFNR